MATLKELSALFQCQQDCWEHLSMIKYLCAVHKLQGYPISESVAAARKQANGNDYKVM